MTHGHFIERCAAGHVVNQCRCIGPKSERVLPGPCRCPTASTAPIAHVVATPAPAMPSEGELLWQRFGVIAHGLSQDGQVRRAENVAGLVRLVAEERAAARLEAIQECVSICLARIRKTAIQGHNHMTETETEAWHCAELLRSLSAPPQKTQEEMTDG